MVKDYKRYLAGQIGESLVVAQLGLHGIVATSFSGNLPEADIAASYQGKTLLLQVKAMWGKSAHVKAENLIDITLDHPKQHVKPKAVLSNPDMIFVYVKLSKVLSEIRYFMLTHQQLQTIIYTGYQSYLDNNNGERPNNKTSTHAAISIKQLANYEGNWGLIKDRLGMPLDQI